MATIPQSIDRGARPSLRSGRVDVPDRGGLIVGDALANAANTFVAVMQERKVKQDKFNYSMNKNDLLIADIQSREVLKDDQDWSTYDERYRVSMRKAQDEIGSRINNAHDRAIFDAESRLMVERGSVAVSEYGRTVEIDEKVANLDNSLAGSREAIILADPATRNDLLLTQLDAITALESEGVLTDVKAESTRQKFTQDVALATLSSMAPEEREKVLEASIANRSGGPVSAKDIRAGKGTGSIADFLHSDTAAKMLKITKEENKITKERTEAFAVVDDAFATFPEDGAARMKYIREQTKGNADVRARAEGLGVARNTEMEISENRRANQFMDSASQLIEEGFPEDDEQGRTFVSMEDFPQEELARLNSAQIDTLKKHIKNVMDNDGFSVSTDTDKYYEWQGMADSAKADTNLNTAEWQTTFTRKDWDRLVAEKGRITTAQESGKPPPSYKGDTDDEMLTNALLGSGLFDGKPPQSSSEYGQWARIDQAFNNALIDESERRTRKGESGDLNADDRRKILSETLRETVWLRRDRLGPNILWLARFEREPALLSELTPAQKREAFLPLAEAAVDIIPDDFGGIMSVEEKLRNWADSLGVDPSDKDIEEAYFYYKHAEGNSEQKAKDRLAGVKGL